MADQAFARLVSLACHDLRTPLATVNGFSKTLLRTNELGERDGRFIAVIAEAAVQLADLLDLLALAARITSGQYDPVTTEVSTLALVDTDDEHVEAAGSGETIEVDAPALERALRALATTALRHGPVERVTWTVHGRDLELAPITPAAAPVVTGEQENEFGALVARLAIEHAGGSLLLEGESLLVRL